MLRSRLKWAARIALGVGLSIPTYVAAQEPRQAVLPEARELIIRGPEDLPNYPFPRISPPPTVSNELPEEADQPVELDQAICMGLERARVVRSLAGLTAVSSGRTIYDAAATNTTIDQNRARFDPTFQSLNTFLQNDIPNGLFGPGGPPNSIIGGAINNGFQSTNGISKRFLTGATVGANINSFHNNNRIGGLALNPADSGNVALSITQPLLQGSGYAANIAPIIVSRIDTERSFFDVKDSVQELVRGTAEGYWQLLFSDIEVWTREQQVAQAKEALDRAAASVEANRVDIRDESQARVTYEQFRAALITARATRLQREAALRNLIGVPPGDGRRVVPATLMRSTRVPIVWEEVLEIAQSQRPDIIQLKLVLDADQQLLTSANNQALPQLNLVGQYRWNGLEGTTPLGTRINDNGRFNDWQMGVNFSVPIGLRRERAQIRQREILIMRDRANLEQQLHSTAHTLAQNLRNLDQFYEQYIAFRRLREAARENLEAQFQIYRAGREDVLFLRVLQAIADWGNAVLNEAQSLVLYNVELVNLERQTGTILESHGIRFYEERYGSIGPLGRLFDDVEYPESLRPGPNERTPPLPEPDQWKRPDAQQLRTENQEDEVPRLPRRSPEKEEDQSEEGSSPEPAETSRQRTERRSNRWGETPLSDSVSRSPWIRDEEPRRDRTQTATRSKNSKRR